MLRVPQTTVGALNVACVFWFAISYFIPSFPEVLFVLVGGEAVLRGACSFFQAVRPSEDVTVAAH